jgi:hypothetical protein
LVEKENENIDEDDVKIDNQIAYLEQAEHDCYRARDYGTAEHHRNMQKILRELKKYRQKKE